MVGGSRSRSRSLPRAADVRREGLGPPALAHRGGGGRRAASRWLRRRRVSRCGAPSPVAEPGSVARSGEPGATQRLSSAQRTRVPEAGFPPERAPGDPRAEAAAGRPLEPDASRGASRRRVARARYESASRRRVAADDRRGRRPGEASRREHHPASSSACSAAESSLSRPIAAVSLRTSATASLDCSARLLSSRQTTRKARP
jgi:hypothetical protein